MLAIIIVWTKRNYKLAMLGVISKSVSQRIIMNHPSKGWFALGL